MPCPPYSTSPGGSLSPDACIFEAARCQDGTEAAQLDVWQHETRVSTTEDACNNDGDQLYSGDAIEVGTYPPNAECQWAVTCHTAPVTVRFSRFNTDLTGADVVSIYNGDEAQEKQVLIRLDRPQETDQVIQSSSDSASMLITFSTDGSVSGDGFSATVECQYAAPEVTRFEVQGAVPADVASIDISGTYTQVGAQSVFVKDSTGAQLYVYLSSDSLQWFFGATPPTAGAPNPPPDASWSMRSHYQVSYPTPGSYSLSRVDGVSAEPVVITVQQVPCEPCEPGRFDHDGNSETPCQLCAAGRASEDSGATSCTSICEAGSYAPPGSTTVGDCIACVHGQYDHDGQGDTECLECPAGRYDFRSSQHTACEHACPAGKSSLPGAITDRDCISCAAGTFAPTEASEACTPCHLGTFTVDAGAQECTECSSGNSTLTRGATARSDCTLSTCSDSSAENFATSDRVSAQLEDCRYDCPSLSVKEKVSCTDCCLVFDADLDQIGSWPLLTSDATGIDIAEVGDVEAPVSEALLSSATLVDCQRNRSHSGCDDLPQVGDLVRMPRTQEEVVSAFEELCHSATVDCTDVVWDNAMYGLLGAVLPLVDVDQSTRTAQVSNLDFVSDSAIRDDDGRWSFPWWCLRFLHL